MRRRSSRLLLALLVLGPTAAAAAQVIDSLKLQPESRLWVEGTSTVRSFKCEAGVVQADVLAEAPGAVSAVMDGQKAVSTVRVTIPAAQLDCRNGTMNGHMLKALKAKDNPMIEFALSSYDIAKSDAGMNGTLTGTLTLGGVPRTITLDAVATEESGALRVRGTHQLMMTEFGLTPPSLMLGTMKVNEKVTVGFDLYLKG